MKRILSYVGTVAQSLLAMLLALLLIGNLYLLVMAHVMGIEHPVLFGYSTAVIASGSMEPALSVDDLIVNHAQSSYTTGDIITFDNGSGLTTHRIVDVTNGGYVTQGDANNAADLETVMPDMVVGRVVGHIPHLGRVLSVLRTPLGMMLLVLAGWLIVALPFFFQKRKKPHDGGTYHE